MLAVTPSFWRQRRVFVTGHTGFKGSWLAFWLRRLGARVAGYALPPATRPNLFEALRLSSADDTFADVRDARRLRDCMAAFAPEVVLHLAAQALVRPSYEDPVGTFATNVVGTAALLDAVRHTPSVRAVVSVASDKCYENREWVWGYRESDPLGGHDPYSASKGAAEIVVDSMRRSFFAPACKNGHPARIASVRAGNVIGGGDWSSDRLVPDIIRACLEGSGVVTLRRPHAVRPWQHVLEPVSAYLGLAERLSTDEPGADQAFNFGPTDGSTRAVIELAEAVVAALGRGTLVHDAISADVHEAALLRLDCSKAISQLGWRPRLDFATTVRMTAEWYGRVALGTDPGLLTAQQIDEFEALLQGAELVRSEGINANRKSL